MHPPSARLVQPVPYFPVPQPAGVRYHLLVSKSHRLWPFFSSFMSMSQIETITRTDLQLCPFLSCFTSFHSCPPGQFRSRLHKFLRCRLICHQHIDVP